MNLAIIPKSKLWFTLSSVLVLASIAAIIFVPLNWGIDFTGGSLLRLSFSERPALDEFKAFADSLNLAGLKLQPAEENAYLIRFGPISQEQHLEIIDKIKQAYPEAEEDQFNSIGPSIGQELKRKSLWAVIGVLLAIVFYVAWAFRKVSQPVQSWKYGFTALVALGHDVFIVLGAYVLLGYFLDYQINTALVAALLTVLGYSVNDTIVIFDRIRENLPRSAGSFAEIVNSSVNQNLKRSIYTSLTTLLVLGTIFIFGGATIQSFVLALIFGIIIGTYSSIFLASPLLVWWRGREEGEIIDSSYSE